MSSKNSLLIFVTELYSCYHYNNKYFQEFKIWVGGEVFILVGSLDNALGIFISEIITQQDIFHEDKGV